MSYQLSLLTEQLLAEPTASYITVVHPAEMPYIWVKLAKAKAAGLDAEMFFMLEMLFQYQMKGHIWDYKDADASRVKLQKVIDQYGGIDNLMLSISLEPREVADTLMAFVFGRPINRVKKLVTAKGVCYSFKPDAFNLTELSAQTATTALELLQFPTYDEYNVGTLPLPILLSLNANERDISYNGNEVYLHQQGHYSVRMKYLHYSNINLRRRKCNSWTVVERTDCIYECSIQFCEEKQLCVPYVPGYGMKNLTNICRFHMNPRESCVKLYFDDMATTCATKCPRPCKTDHFEAYAFPYGASGESITRALLLFNFHDPANSLKIVETAIYDENTLLSNFGGVVSLWCGASIMSIVQFVYFVTTRSCFQKFSPPCAVLDADKWTE